jgi:hypothetical protein
MIYMYLNYPNSRVSIHQDTDSEHIRAQMKPDQRVSRINKANISQELQSFVGGHYQFASTAEVNDMWVEIDFQDRDFELAVAAYVHRLLGKRHKPFARASISIHC